VVKHASEIYVGLSQLFW